MTTAFGAENSPVYMNRYGIVHGIFRIEPPTNCSNPKLFYLLFQDVLGTETTLLGSKERVQNLEDAS